MSRSRKKSSASKICGKSDKKCKSFANRCFRKLTKQRIRELQFDRLPNSIREVSDTYSFDSDGLAMWMQKPGPCDRWTEDGWNKIMRK